MTKRKLIGALVGVWSLGALGGAAYAMEGGEPAGSHLGKNFTGFYGGLKGGFATAYGKVSTGQAPQGSRYDIGGSSPLAGLTLGLGKMWRGFYLGLEGEGNYQDIKSVNTPAEMYINNTYEMKMRYNLGLHAKVGLCGSEVSMYYLKLGAKFAKMNLKVVNNLADEAVDKKPWNVGFSGGFGFDRLFSAKTKAVWGMEFMYAGYGKKSAPVLTNFGTAGFKPHTLSVSAHVLYRL